MKDDVATVAFDPVKYDKSGLAYSGTGYKGQGKTQVKTVAMYDNPYAWDMRAAYVIGTRHGKITSSSCRASWRRT